MSFKGRLPLLKFFHVALILLSGFFVASADEIVKTASLKANPNSGEIALINKSIMEVTDSGSNVTFVVDIPVEGEYYIHFWICPTRLKDGSFIRYDVVVNGENLRWGLSPAIGDWHSESVLDNKPVKLVLGPNVITVKSEYADLPCVEYMFVCRTDSPIDGSSYQKYRAEIEKECLARRANKSEIVVGDTIEANLFMRTDSYDSPLYGFTHAQNVEFRYTFYKLMSFKEGEIVTLSTSGIDKFPHVVEFFNELEPDNYSWTSMSDFNCSTSLNIAIPITGYYYVRVRSYLNGSSGLCNLNINDKYFYDSVPLFSYGKRCVQDDINEYNTFTCNEDGDPMLWIEEGEWMPGRITAFNDDFEWNKGDFEWGLNARIKKTFKRPVHAALISAYDLYSPVGKCDLYINCPNSTIIGHFPNLKPDDAIQSSPASNKYNCISWSGGITSYWEWPLSPGSQFYTGNPLIAFDNFYSSRGYTRDGATPDNASVALWANVDSKGGRIYTHGSITNGDGNVHGYDWESKPGALMRTFHPRNALIGESYGQIVEYYRLMLDKSNHKTVVEEIADETVAIEYVLFNEEEKALIDDGVQMIPIRIYSMFVDLYDEWAKAVSVTPYSNPEQIRDCEEFERVFRFCDAHPECLYVVYDKLSSGELASIILLDGIVLKSQYLMEQLSEVRDSSPTISENNVKIIRPIQSNYIALVRNILDSDLINPGLKKTGNTKPADIEYSNSFEFYLKSVDNSLVVAFGLNFASEVSLNIVDLNGNTILELVPAQMLSSGVYSYPVPMMSRGLFFVQLMVNGRVNIKKLVVE